ncbi:MAG: DUF5615 family PIN-like protein [Methanomassiliicoccales archaeon]|nr:DUF5615 family PIN-like protein [Methanomassiliicoccales archaeon]
MTKSEKGLPQAGTQLPLPFPKHFVIDASVSRPSEWKEMFTENGDQVTTITELGLPQNAPDDVISVTAKGIGAWVLTQDREFHYDAALRGVFYSKIVYLVGTTTRIPADIKALSKATKGAIEQVSCVDTGGNQNFFVIVDLDSGQVRVEATPSPPSELLAILPALSQSRHGLKNADLRKLWGCSRSTAWKKALRLVQEGWLRKAGKTSSCRYLKGRKLEEDFRRIVYTKSVPHRKTRLRHN